MQLPLHPSIVHLPMALAVLMPFVAGGLLLAIWRRWLPRNAIVLATAGQLALVVGCLLALRTGEVDEERVERLVPEAALELHEHAASTFAWAAGGVLALTVLLAMPFVLSHARRFIAVGWAVVLGTLAVLVLGYRTGHAGGELVYRHGAARAFATDAQDAPAPVREHRDHDDH